MSKEMDRGLKVPVYDIRLVRRSIEKGLIDGKEYESHLKKLADDEQNAEYIEIVDETTADDKEDAGDRPDFDQLTFT